MAYDSKQEIHYNLSNMTAVDMSFDEYEVDFGMDASTAARLTSMETSVESSAEGRYSNVIKRKARRKHLVTKDSPLLRAEELRERVNKYESIATK